MKKLPVVLFGLLLSTPVLAGQIFKWVDAQGNVHYSDTPPPASAQVKQKSVQVRNMPVYVEETPKKAASAPVPVPAAPPAEPAANGKPVTNAPPPADNTPK